MDTRSLAQTMQEVFTIVNRNYIIDDRLTSAVQRHRSLTFVASKYNNTSKGGGLGHLLTVFTSSIPRCCQPYQTRMPGWHLQLIAVVSIEMPKLIRVS